MPPISKPDPWLPYRKPRPGARVRLFCFPYAGGGASMYRGWQDELPPSIEVCAVQLPGREGRLGDAPVAEMARLVPMIADGLAAHLTQPFALFGHSMGAAIGFELCRELRRRGGPRPLHLFVSACPAPHIADTDATHALPEPELMRGLGGMSDEILQHRELMEMILPVFRADAAVTETYVHAEEAPLEAPITAFGGLSDAKATRDDMDAWRRHTAGAFALAMVAGNHFYLQGEGRRPVQAAIARAIG
jgi:medium-chain acyl-[acyl-carrier-protein] hydrolase